MASDYDVRNFRIGKDGASSIAWQAACDTNVTDYIKADQAIISVFIGSSSHTPATEQFKLQWKDTTDTGSFADVTSSGEIIRGISAGAISNTDPVGGTAGCASPVNDSEEVENESPLQTGDINAVVKNEFAELQFCIDLSNADDGHIYDFQLYSVTESSAMEACGQITILAGAQTAYKDITTRVGVTENNYKHVTTKVDVDAKTFLDITTKVDVSAPETPAYKHITTKVDVDARSYLDISSKVDIDAQSYLDVITKVNIEAISYLDISSKVDIDAKSYLDITTNVDVSSISLPAYLHISTKVDVQVYSQDYVASMTTDLELIDDMITDLELQDDMITELELKDDMITELELKY